MWSARPTRPTLHTAAADSTNRRLRGHPQPEPFHPRRDVTEMARRMWPARPTRPTLRCACHRHRRARTRGAPVYVIFALVRQRHVDDVRQPVDVDATRSHICADQEAHITILEGLHSTTQTVHFNMHVRIPQRCLSQSAVSAALCTSKQGRSLFMQPMLSPAQPPQQHTLQHLQHRHGHASLE
jgi:hypothetical protein